MKRKKEKENTEEAPCYCSSQCLIYSSPLYDKYGQTLLSMGEDRYYFEEQNIDMEKHSSSILSVIGLYIGKPVIDSSKWKHCPKHDHYFVTNHMKVTTSSTMKLMENGRFDRWNPKDGCKRILEVSQILDVIESNKRLVKTLPAELLTKVAEYAGWMPSFNVLYYKEVSVWSFSDETFVGHIRMYVPYRYLCKDVNVYRIALAMIQAMGGYCCTPPHKITYKITPLLTIQILGRNGQIGKGKRRVELIQTLEDATTWNDLIGRTLVTHDL